MEEDWDLNAVVRSCHAGAAVAAEAPASTADASSRFGDDPFFDPSFDENPSYRTEGLEEICNASLFPQSQQRAAPEIFPVAPLASNAGGIDHLQSPPVNDHLFSLPATNLLGGRHGKRKNQQKKTVCQMTEEELSNDSWAWRKYGQKPIKGSPHPRNYYKCSTSKGCGARKQVERSPIDSAMFIVTYSGEHIHPRPTHRSSLAGRTKEKSGPAEYKPISGHCTTAAKVTNPSCSSSSPASVSSFSPTTPLMEAKDERCDQDTFI